MLAQSAIHEKAPESAAAFLGDGKAKKAGGLKGLAGLFSEILSQAMKGAKATDGSKPAADPKGDSRSGQDARAELLRRSAPRARAHAPAEGGGGAQRPAVMQNPSDKGSEAAAPRGTDEAQARRARERKQASHAEAEYDGEARLRKAGDERRRAKAKSDAGAEESVPAASALAGARNAAGAALAKAKPIKEGGDPEEQSAGAARKAERTSSEPKVSVLDLRRSAESRREAAAKSEASAKAGTDEPAKDAVQDIKSADAGRGLARELTLDSRAAGGAEGASGKAEPGAGAGRGPDFQSMLAERLREAWNGEIVQSARIVLRDGDAGTIRLRLRPESLGSVKIDLNLTDNNISGRIVVETEEAKSAFERNMGQLADAFAKGGFESAKLEVSVGGGSGGGASGNGAGAESAGPFYSERLRSAVGSPADPATASSAYARRGGAVDILA